MSGPQPIPYAEMLAWSRISGTIVLGEEWTILRRMDRTFLEATAIEQTDALERAKAAKQK